MKSLLLAMVLTAVVTTGFSQLIPYRKGTLWGLADKTGNLVVPAEYDYISATSFGYFVVEKDYVSSLLDNTGALVVGGTRFSYFSESNNERFVVASIETYKNGMIDKTGKELIPCNYDYITNIGELNCIGQDGDLLYVVGYDGSKSKALKGYTTGYYSNETYSGKFEDYGYKVISDSEYKQGIVNAKGKVIVKPQYFSIYTLSNGLFICQNQEYKYGAVNVKGKVVIPFEYEYLSTPSEGLIAASKDGMYGYLDLKGKVKLPFNYTSAESFSSGKAIVSENYYYTMIDKTGNKVWSNSYESVYRDKGLLIAMQNGYYGLIDENGTAKTDFTYESLYATASNVLSFYEASHYGAISPSGTVIVKAEYDDVGSYMGDSYYGSSDYTPGVTIFPVKRGGLYAYFNVSGKQLTDFKYTSAYAEKVGSGYAEVYTLSGRSGYIDLNGKEYFSEPKMETVTVSNITEFVENIGDDRIIIMKPGVYDISELSKDSYYGSNVSYTENYNTYAYDLTISDLNNCTIKSDGGGLVEIINTDVYANVLNLSYNYNVTIEGIKVGHGKEAGICSGNVIYMNYNTGVKINNCDLYGSGAIGIVSDGDVLVNVNNTKIHDCTYGSLSFSNGNNVTFDNCKIEDNAQFDQIGIYYTDNVTFSNCTFRNLKTNEDDSYTKYYIFNVQQYYGSTVKLNKCTFENNYAHYFVNDESLLEQIDLIEKNNTYKHGRSGGTTDYDDWGW